MEGSGCSDQREPLTEIHVAWDSSQTRQKDEATPFVLCFEPFKCNPFNIIGRVALLVRFGIIRIAEKYRLCGRDRPRQLMEWVDLGLERSEW